MIETCQCIRLTYGTSAMQKPPEHSSMHTSNIHRMPLLQAGRRIAADSCSLIFLNRLHLLETYACMHRVVLTQSIYDELTCESCGPATAENKALYKKLFAGTAFPIEPAETPGAEPPAALSFADRTIIHALHTLNLDGILTDDKKVCRYCRTRDIPYINSPMALFVLLSNGVISHGRYTTALQALYSMGRYGTFIHMYMEEIFRAYCANAPVPRQEQHG